MNTKHNSIKHLNMNHTPQRITPRRAKLPLLAAVLILFNIASAWGQQPVYMNRYTHNQTTPMSCSTTYTLTLSGSQSQNDSRNHTFTNTNGAIKVEEFTFTALRQRNNNNNNNSFDYLEIRINGASSDTSYGNTTSGVNWDQCSSGRNSTYYTAQITIPSFTVEPDANGQASVQFRFVESVNDQDGCSHPNFVATIKPICCPDCPNTLTEELTTADGATSATLSWGEVSTDATYSVAVTKDGTPYNDGTHSDGTYNRGATESLTLDNLPNGTYTWILTFIAEGCTVSCEERTFTVIACPTLTSPADGATITTGEPLLQWNAMPGATAYNVYIKNDGDDTYTTHTVTATSYAMPCSQYSNGTYTWRVVPVVNGTEVAGLTCPERTFAKNASLDCVKAASLYPRYNTIDTLGKRWLSWDPVPCADKYEIYVAPAASVSPTDILTSDDTRLFTTDDTEYLLPIVPEGNYYWTVIPVNTKGTTITTDDIKAQGCGVYTFCVRYETSSDHSVSPSTQGQDFFFSLMENGYQNARGKKYTAVIAPKESGWVKFHFYARGIDTVINVTKNETATITLRESDVHHVSVGDTYKNRTVHVESNVDISLYIANEATNSFDASIVLPTHALGTDYMIQTYVNGIHNSGYTTPTSANPCFMIIGTKNDTKVRITGPKDKITALRPEPTNVTTENNISYYDIDLNEGDSYFIRTHYDRNNDNGRVLDLSGLRVTVVPRTGHPEDSCKTIAVFNGNTLTRIPAVTTNNMDHIFEQAYSINNWGTMFAITSSDGYQYASGYNNQPDVDYIRITAAEAATGVTIYKTGADGTITTTTTTITNAGGTYEFTLPRSDGSCYIKTTKPAACYLYQRSGYAISGYDGDPSMVWIAPIERGIEQLTFSTFSATGIANTDHWVNIVIPADALSTTDQSKFVKLDGTNISGSFAPLSGNPDYMYARRKINHGTHTLVSEGKGKMVLHVYGLGDVRGYAYAAGSAAVPFRSSITLASGDGPAVDVETVPSDYHFCGGVTYRFNTNSTSSNVDSVWFDFDDGKGIQKLIIAKSPTGLEYELPARDEVYNITAYIYSTIYDNELCQNSIVVDTVKDKALVFVPANEHIYDTVCNGTPYTFKRSYWTYNNDGVLEEHFVEFTSDAVTEQMDPITINGYSEFGCPLQIVFHLTVYPAVDGGSIEKEEVECKESSLSITKLVNKVSASGGDPSAHYQWQKLEDGNWVDITGQTSDSYTVTAAGTYRRAYLSDCGDAHSTSTDTIVVEHAGSFNPGTHIDDTVNICYGSTFSRMLGGDIGSSSIYLHTDGKYYTPIEGETYDVPVPMQWQDSVPGGQWKKIDGATAYNYTIPTETFTQTTYYRRIITGVGSCGLAMNMGVFGVILKPMFEATPKVLQGCYGENNAVVNFAISGGSGNFTVTYSGPTSGTATLENGVYKCSPLRQGTSNYVFTIKDNVHGCETTVGNIAIPSPAKITITQPLGISACEGTLIQIPVPAITGGAPNYSVNMKSSGLEIPSSGITINNVGANTTSTYSYQLPSNVEAHTAPYTIQYKVTDAEGCTEDEDFDVVTVKAIPQFDLISEDVTKCLDPDGKIRATITNHTEGTIYDYYIDTERKANDVSATTYEFTSLFQGVHTIRVTANNQCSAEQTATVSDNLQLDVVLSVSGATKSGEVYYACPKAQVTIDITEINGNALAGDGGVASSYEYRFSDAGNYGATYSYTPTTATSCNNTLEIPVHVKQSETGCVDDDLKVTIITQDNTKPVISGDFGNVDVTTYFCPTFQVPNLTAQVRKATTDNCTDTADLNVTQTIASGDYPVSGGAKTITVTVTDLCGKYENRGITVTPKPWPLFAIGGDSHPDCYCHGDNITLTPVIDTNDQGIAEYVDASYKWYKIKDNDGAIILDVNNISADTPALAETKELVINSAKVADGGTYRLTITDPNGCTSSADITICVHDPIEFHLE